MVSSTALRYGFLIFVYNWHVGGGRAAELVPYDRPSARGPLLVGPASYEKSYGFLWTFLVVPMRIPIGSYDNSYGILCAFI